MITNRPKLFSSLAFLKSVFDTRLATAGCLLVAIAAKSLIAWIYLDLETDKSVFLLFTRSFLNTGVFAEPVYDAGSGSLLSLYNPAVITPLYSLLATPLLFVTNSYVVTDFILSILGWALLFPALFRIAFLLLQKWWLVNLFILLVAFYLYPHEMESPPKDTLAAAFSLWTILLMQTFLQKSPSIANTLWLALSVAGIFLIKLTYAPVALTSVLLLLIFVLLKRSRWHVLHFLLFSVFVLSIGFAVYQFVYLPAHRLSNPVMDKLGRDGIPLVRGFYPQNLLYTFPFISSSLLNINFWGVQIEHRINVSFVKVMEVFKLIDAFAMVVLAGGLVYYFRKIFVNRLHLSLIMVSASVVGSLFFMSITTALTHADKYAPNWWTYVAEARFYFLPILVLQLFLFRFISRTKNFKALRWAALSLLLFEAAHGLYFDMKQGLNLAAVKAELQNKSPVKKTTALAVQMSRRHSDFGLVTTDNALRRYVQLWNLKAHSVAKTPIDMSWAKKGSVFLFVTHPEDTAIRAGISALQLNKADTSLPFVLQYYKKKD